MIRLAIIAAILAGVVGTGWWLYERGADNARKEQVERTLEDAGVFNEGDGTGHDCSGLDRLLGNCASD